MKFRDVVEFYKKLVSIERNFYERIEFDVDIITELEELVRLQSKIATEDLRRLIFDMKKYIRSYLDIYQNRAETVEDFSSGEPYLVLLPDEAGEGLIKIYKVNGYFIVDDGEELFKVAEDG